MIFLKSTSKKKLLFRKAEFKFIKYFFTILQGKTVIIVRHINNVKRNLNYPENHSIRRNFTKTFSVTLKTSHLLLVHAEMTEGKKLRRDNHSIIKK